MDSRLFDFLFPKNSWNNIFKLVSLKGCMVLAFIFFLLLSSCDNSGIEMPTQAVISPAAASPSASLEVVTPVDVTPIITAPQINFYTKCPIEVGDLPTSVTSGGILFEYLGEEQSNDIRFISIESGEANIQPYLLPEGKIKSISPDGHFALIANFDSSPIVWTIFDLVQHETYSTLEAEGWYSADWASGGNIILIRQDPEDEVFNEFIEIDFKTLTMDDDEWERYNEDFPSPRYAPVFEVMDYESFSPDESIEISSIVRSGSRIVEISDVINSKIIWHDERTVFDQVPPPTWTKDGQRVAFVLENESGFDQIVLFDQKDGSIAEITPPIWRQILYQEWAQDGTSLHFSSRDDAIVDNQISIFDNLMKEYEAHYYQDSEGRASFRYDPNPITGSGFILNVETREIREICHSNANFLVGGFLHDLPILLYQIEKDDGTVQLRLLQIDAWQSSFLTDTAPGSFFNLFGWIPEITNTD